jgi:hypothetical protein
MTWRTSTTPAHDPKSLKDRVRLPTPSEEDSMFADLLIEATEKLLAEKRAKENVPIAGRSAAPPPGTAQSPDNPSVTVQIDSSKGYTIDVSKPGAIQVHDPFDKILKILGARLSRNNPFYVEVDPGFAVDLGVVSIDRARVRLNLSPGGPPEITAFGASVDIPGALQGSGYAQVGTDAQGNSVIAGAMDLTITPVNVRALSKDFYDRRSEALRQGHCWTCSDQVARQKQCGLADHGKPDQPLRIMALDRQATGFDFGCATSANLSHY